MSGLHAGDAGASVTQKETEGSEWRPGTNPDTRDSIGQGVSMMAAAPSLTSTESAQVIHVEQAESTFAFRVAQYVLDIARLESMVDDLEATFEAVNPAVDAAGDNSTSPKPRARVDYDSVESLWEALKTEDVVMLRASWLLKWAREGHALPRRQECPPEAFIYVDELQKMHQASTAKPRYNENKRAPIIAVSHFWREKEHPDKNGVTLLILCQALESQMQNYAKFSLTEMGVFFDWCLGGGTPAQKSGLTFDTFLDIPYNSLDNYKDNFRIILLITRKDSG